MLSDRLSDPFRKSPCQILCFIRKLLTDASSSVSSLLPLLLCCRFSKFPLHQFFSGHFYIVHAHLLRSIIFRLDSLLITLMDLCRIFAFHSISPDLSHSCFCCGNSCIQAVCTAIFIFILISSVSDRIGSHRFLIDFFSSLFLHPAKFPGILNRERIIFLPIPQLFPVTFSCRCFTFQFGCLFFGGGLLSIIACIFLLIHENSFPKKLPLTLTASSVPLIPQTDVLS